jgi:hypothetical protein
MTTNTPEKSTTGDKCPFCGSEKNRETDWYKCRHGIEIMFDAKGDSYIPRQPLCRAFLAWDSEFLSHPHQFLNSTRTSQLTPEERATASAEHLAKKNP